MRTRISDGVLTLRAVAERQKLPTTGRPSQLTGGAYDIRGLTFAPSSWTMFAARLNGRISVFKMTPGGQPAMVSPPGEDVDSPAVSTDGRSFAYKAGAPHRTAAEVVFRWRAARARSN
jgi:hypothetical protein